MKKLLIIAAAAVVLALGIVALASANAGPHGNYPLNTDACAACHRAHTAVGDYLLLADTADNLCYTCHGNGMTITDPFAGTTSTAGGRLNGGGFFNLSGATGPAATSMHQVEGVTRDTFKAVAFGGTTQGVGIAGVLECVSCHDPHGSTNYRLLRDANIGHGAPTSWGGEGGTGPAHAYVGALNWVNSQVVEAGAETHNVPATAALYTAGANANYNAGMREFCANCHKSYLTRSDSAAVASNGVPGPNDWPGGNSPDGFGPFPAGHYVWQHSYDVTTPPNATGAPGSDAARSKGWELTLMYPGTQMVPGMAGNWYELETQGPSATTYGAEQARYRHATSRSYSKNSGNAELRFAYSYNGLTANNQFVCTTCHFAHGTSAAASGYASDAGAGTMGAGNPLTGFATSQNQATGNYDTNNGLSALLYIDNRGVCHRCHQTNK